MKYGVNNYTDSNKDLNYNLLNFLNQNNIIKPVRVLSIVLDDNHPRFKELGEWNSIGFIEYEDIINPLFNDVPPVSKPLNTNNKHYPLINEIVYIFSLPNTDIKDFTTSNNSYYINVVSLWNHPHHNGFPSNPNNLSTPQQKDYTQTSLGNVRKVIDKSTEINLGDTFKERSNIHPLLPFEGDIIFEGRWGNSIRLGSTVNKKNNWSEYGENGDPIFIIRNGQGNQNEKGWIPIVEDINNDNSSIYLTSKQIIPLKNPINFSSYENPPIDLSKYNNPQIILNSNRILLNSNKDHIILNSNKSINLNSIESVNIDTKNTILSSNKIFIGSKNSNEPILLGNKTYDILSTLIINLKSFMDICSKLVSSPSGTPIPQLNVVSKQMSSILEALNNNLNEIKSKKSFTE